MPILLALLAAGSATPATAERLRVAFWNSELERQGPGLLLRDALKGGIDDIDTARRVIADLDADVLVLSGLDFDATGAALSALNAGLPLPYPHLRALRPNTGVPSGADLDGDGHSDGPADALAFGFFPGQGGMAVLSRRDFRADGTADFSGFAWRDLPGNLMPAGYANLAPPLPLSSRGHHLTGLSLANGQALDLLTWHATSPAFDSEADENGRRNHDETAFWTRYLDGALPFAPPAPAFVLLGQANADPEKGDGDRSAIRALLADPRLQDLLPGDTVDFGGTIGPLRVSYILPAAGLKVLATGRMERPPGVRHWPIWIDLDL